MAKLTDDQSEWGTGITRIEETDSVLGGPPEKVNIRYSPVNYALQEVVNRLNYLRDTINGISIPTLSQATETIAGVARLVTSTLAQGSSITDKTDLSQYDHERLMTLRRTREAMEHLMPQATTTRIGGAEIANQGEGRSGTNNEMIMTCLRVLDFLRNGTGVVATETRKGTLEIADQTQRRAASSNGFTMTPSGTLDAVRNGSGFEATTGRKGVSQRATQAQVNRGTDEETHLTPDTFKDSDAIQSILPIPSNFTYVLTNVTPSITFTVTTLWHIGNLFCIEIAITSQRANSDFTLNGSVGIGFVSAMLYNRSDSGGKWSSNVGGPNTFQIRSEDTSGTFKFLASPSGSADATGDKVRFILQTL